MSEVYFKQNPFIVKKNWKHGIIIKNPASGCSAKYIGRSILELLDCFIDPVPLNEALIIISRFSPDGTGNLFYDLIELTFLIPVVNIKYVNCPVCMCDQYDTKYNNIDPRFNVEFSFVRCKKCGIYYLNPIMQKALYYFYYVDLGYYRNKRYDTIPFYLSKIFSLANQNKISIVRQALHEIENKSILDVGCGDGTFIQYADKFGAKCYGLDIDKYQIQKLKALNASINWLECSFLEIERDKLKKMDLITMWSYLEHEIYQNKSLSIAHSILKDDGYLIVEIPIIGGGLHKIFKSKWPFWDPPFHVLHHSKRTFVETAKKNGFKLEKIYCLATSPFILKYSSVLLALMNSLNISYSSTWFDKIVVIFSKIFTKIEVKFDLTGKCVFVFKKIS